MRTYGKKPEPAPNAEYSVEFESVAKFLAYFKDQPGLSDHEIIARALKIADSALGNGGNLCVERTSREGCYAFTALGVDQRTAHVLSKPLLFEKPKLRIVK